MRLKARKILIEAVKCHMMQKFAFRFCKPYPAVLPGSRSTKRQMVAFLAHIQTKRFVEVLALLQLGYSQNKLTNGVNSKDLSVR